MSIFQSILLGIIQGLTEFIPVSSTAHLLLSQRLLGLEATSELFSFTVLVQLGTLLALIVYFWVDIWAIFRALLFDLWYGAILRKNTLFQDAQARLGWYLLIGSVPAAVAGVLLKNLVEKLFSMPLIEVSIRMLITISLILAAEYWGKQNRKIRDFRWEDALWVGTAQVLSVFPGASRSGSTIAGGMLRGFDRQSAARFAFLLSVPIMFAAGAYETLDLLRSDQVSGSFLPSILTGIFTSAVVGYLAIRWLLGYLARRPLYIFSVYCTLVLLGIAILLVV